MRACARHVRARELDDGAVPDTDGSFMAVQLRVNAISVDLWSAVPDSIGLLSGIVANLVQKLDGYLRWRRFFLTCTPL